MISTTKTKTDADTLKRIEVWWLLRGAKGLKEKRGSIEWGEDGSDGSIGYLLSLEPEEYLRLSYTTTDRFTDEKKDLDYRISLLKTPCRLGGHRYWFECPLSVEDKYCGKRVGVLYLADGYFGCRHCHDLTYQSKRINSNYKDYHLLHSVQLLIKAQKLEKTIKRRTWGGLETRKEQRLLKLYRTMAREHRESRYA